MKKQIALLLVGATALSLVACGKSTNGTETTEAGAVSSTDSDTYYGEVELCDYKNISVEKTTYPVSDDDVATQIDSIFEENEQINELDRAIDEGDYIEVLYTETIDGEVIYDCSDESEGMTIGEEILGAEIDEALIGLSKGDTLQQTVTFDDDFYDTDIAGQTVDFDITVSGVYEIVDLEYNEESIKSLGYESEEDMKEQVRAELEEQNEQQSQEELQANVITAIVENSTFTDYNQDIYDDYAAQVEADYEDTAEMFGFDSVDELYEAFGMTQDDVDAEVLNYVYEMIAMNKIIELEGITLTDDEYQQGLEEYAEEYEYDSVDEFLEDYDEDSVKFWMLENKAIDLILQTATVTEVESTETEEYYEDEDDADYEESSDDIEWIEDEDAEEGDAEY